MKTPGANRVRCKPSATFRRRPHPRQAFSAVAGNDSGDERIELREQRYTKVEVTLRGGKEVARGLVALRLNPWWYPHALDTPKDAQTSGPFTLGRAIHSNRGVGCTGGIAGVAVFSRALTRRSTDGMS